MSQKIKIVLLHFIQEDRDALIHDRQRREILSFYDWQFLNNNFGEWLWYDFYFQIYNKYQGI